MSTATATATPLDSHAARARIGRAAHLTYGLAVAGLGVLILIFGDLNYVFQPVPRWVPLRHPLSYASGAALLAGGLALLVPKTARLAALVITFNFVVVWLLLLNLPTALAKPLPVGNWEGCGLDMACLAGGFIILAGSRTPPAGRAGRLFGESGVTLARRIYALGVPLVGLAHFADGQDATVYVPTWLPFRIGWVYLTGAGHIAAGLAILFGVLPLLAATLEAAQITAFVILSHIPAVYAAPRDRVQWAMLVYAVAIAASAWLVAVSVRAPRRR